MNKCDEFQSLVNVYKQVQWYHFSYGWIERKSPSEKLKNERLAKNFAESKTKFAVWFVSHCATPGQREV